MSKLRSVVKLIQLVPSQALAGLLLLGALASVQPVAAQTPAAEAGAARAAVLPAPVIGVVDIIKAVELYPRYIKLRNDLQEKYDQEMLKLQDFAKQLDELRGTIQVLPDEAAEERADKEFQLQMGLQRKDFLLKSFQARLQVEELRNTLVVYEDLEIAVAKVAAARGVTLVLSKQDIEPSVGPVDKLPARELQARVKAFDRRQVWFASEELDLTGDVIKFLQVPIERGAAGKAAGANGGDAAKAPGAGKDQSGQSPREGK